MQAPRDHYAVPRPPMVAVPGMRRAATNKAKVRTSWAKIHTNDLASPLWHRTRGAARHVYLVLLSRADKDTRTCAVGLRTLGGWAAMKVWSVRRALGELVGLGMVEKQRRWGIDEEKGWSRAGHLPTLYKLPLLSELAGELLGPVKGVDVDALVHDEDGPGPDAVEKDKIQALARELAEGLLVDLEKASDSLKTWAELHHKAGVRVAVMLLGAEAGRTLPSDPRARLDVVGALHPRGDRRRFRAPESFNAALQSQSTYSHAGHALLSAQATLAGTMAAIKGESPRLGDWRRLVADCRVALWLARRAGELRTQAEGALDIAVGTWGQLSPLPAARPTSTSTKATPVEDPPPAEGEPWRPPRAWCPSTGRTVKTWWSQRRTWEQATKDGVFKVCQKLRAQGFDPGWPDPPG